MLTALYYLIRNIVLRIMARTNKNKKGILKYEDAFYCALKVDYSAKTITLLFKTSTTPPLT
jgi:hypothetical protein